MTRESILLHAQLLDFEVVLIFNWKHDEHLSNHIIIDTDNTKCKTTNENIRDILDLKNERIFNRKHAEFESQLSVVPVIIKHSLRKLSLTTSHCTTCVIGAPHLNRYVKKMFIHKY